MRWSQVLGTNRPGKVKYWLRNSIKGIHLSSSPFELFSLDFVVADLRLTWNFSTKTLVPAYASNKFLFHSPKVGGFFWLRNELWILWRVCWLPTMSGDKRIEGTPKNPLLSRKNDGKEGFRIFFFFFISKGTRLQVIWALLNNFPFRRNKRNPSL